MVMQFETAFYCNDATPDLLHADLSSANPEVLKGIFYTDDSKSADVYSWRPQDV